VSAFALNETHDPNRRSWVSSANEPGADFSIQNLPFGVFRSQLAGKAARVGIAIGDSILDVAACTPFLASGARAAAESCAEATVVPLIQLGSAAWSDLRHEVSRLLDESNLRGREAAERYLVRQCDAEMMLPFKATSFTDFFASIHHATNAGRMFRPDQPLLPNYKYVPIAYQGRVSTFRVTDSAIRRPYGQVRSSESIAPQRKPSEHLDYEVELGVIVGKGSVVGEPVLIDHAYQHIFGLCLLNDWSARDIQSWEYQPLGPFLAKSFATSISPWIVTEEALRPYRTSAFARPASDPEPLAYLDSEADRRAGGLAVTLEAYLRSKEMVRLNLQALQLSRASAASLYWTVAQMLTHQTSNGCNLEIGDIVGSGTISGEGEGSYGSLLEITKRGKMPLQLPTGEERGFLEDGDEAIFRGYCEREGFARIGFGTCTGTVIPA
jgi:fumarylacetoacetase